MEYIGFQYVIMELPFKPNLHYFEESSKEVILEYSG